MRAERIVHDEKIQEEVDIQFHYASKNVIHATLFIEVTDESKIKPVLNQFIGLTTGKTIYLEINKEKIFALFLKKVGKKKIKISSVHYIQFHLNDDQLKKLIDPENIAEIGIDYNDYSHKSILSSSTKKSLYLDTQ